LSGRLAGRVALVTGARGGIGAAIARRFAEQGALVAGADIGPGVEAELALHCDVSDPAQAEAAVAATVALLASEAAWNWLGREGVRRERAKLLWGFNVARSAEGMNKIVLIATDTTRVELGLVDEGAAQAAQQRRRRPHRTRRCERGRERTEPAAVRAGKPVAQPVEHQLVRRAVDNLARPAEPPAPPAPARPHPRERRPHTPP
jgi:NAD(P)-dependent dehydrogenase (short-subunit alcohol dehydrogenase family)